MRSFRKILIIVLTLAISLSMAVPAFGASGDKTIYLTTKYNEKSYDSEGNVEYTINTKYTYNKGGLLKSYKYSDEEKIEKGTYYYNSKHQATKLLFTSTSRDGERKEKYCYKFSYNKNGYLRKKTGYWIDNGKYVKLWEYRYTWNNKGQLKKCVSINEWGNTDSTEWYTYDKKRQLIKYKSHDPGEENSYIVKYKYNDDGQYISSYSKSSFPYFPFYEECAYDGNKKTVIRYEDKSKESIIEKSIETYKNGNLIKSKYYSGFNIEELSNLTNYNYKKITLKSKYKKAVLRQQACWDYIAP